MGTPIARLGDHSSHGGTIISAAGHTIARGQPVARVGDMHSCPLFFSPGHPHGITPILNGSPHVLAEGRNLARAGSITGCGAVIVAGQPNAITE